MLPQNSKRLSFLVTMLCLVGIVTIFLVEAILRLTLPTLVSPELETTLCVFPPKTHRRFQAPPGVLPGINGPTIFSTNSLGIRGDETSAADQYRILCIGGSATECMYLDDSRTWPYLLQQCLSRRCGSHGKIWVGNIGKSGLNTVDHIIQVKRQVPSLPTSNCLLLLIGVNDCIATLMGSKCSVNAFDPEKREANLFFHVDDYIKNYKDFKTWPIRRTAIWSFARLTRNTFCRTPDYQDDEAAFYVTKRKTRASATRIIDHLPSLDLALQRYRINLVEIKRLADSMKVRLVLVTRPTMWRKDLDTFPASLLWIGGICNDQGNPQAYYSVGALAAAMELFNSTLIDFCNEAHVEFIDLASHVPESTSAFYDDCHFNDDGSIIISKIVCSYLQDSICRNTSN